MASSAKNLSDFSHMEVGSAEGLRFALVVSQWNAQVTGALLEGALEALAGHGALADDIEVVQVPGSYELVSGADIVFGRTAVDAVICLGCIVQGETRHFEFICQAVAQGIANVGIKHGKPAIFGVLTTDTLEQAMDRAGGQHGNKGEEAAVTAIQMALLNHKY